MSVSINIVETKVSGDAPVEQVVTANIAPTETVTASIPATRGPAGQTNLVPPSDILEYIANLDQGITNG